MRCVRWVTHEVKTVAVYDKATLVPKSGKKNLYVCVTVPEPLRPIIGLKQKYKTTGTDNWEQARDRLRDLEAQIWAEFDKAELTNHPLSLAVTSREVVWLFPEQLRSEFVPVFHRLQGRP